MKPSYQAWNGYPAAGTDGRLQSRHAPAPAPEPHSMPLPHAPEHAVLGDAIRLSLIAQRSSSEQRSVTQLAERSALTRRAITKYLRVLEGAGIACSFRSGRQSLLRLQPEPIQEANEFLDVASEEGDWALARLNRCVEE